MKATINKAKAGKKKVKPKPALPWQTGDYSRFQQYSFHLPYNFLLLCRLWQVTPREVLGDFMDNVAFGSWKREGRDTAKEQLAAYIISMGYGQEYYSPADIQTMFKELDALGMLFPKVNNPELQDAYVEWRSKHQTAWFNNWFTKVRRDINDVTGNENV